MIRKSLILVVALMSMVFAVAAHDHKSPEGGKVQAMTPMYTPKEDKIIELADGRLQQVAVKGVPMALADAVRYGIISPDEARNVGGQNIPLPRPLTPSELKGVPEGSSPPPEGATATGASEVTPTARRTTRRAPSQ